MGPDKKFDIALRPCNRTGGQTAYRPVFFDQILLHLVANAFMDFGVPHDAAFAHFFAARLKLWFDKCDQLRTAFGKGQRPI